MPITARMQTLLGEAKMTFIQARAAILAYLATQQWKVVDGLKVPHATSPDGTTRLWFKAQAVYLTQTDGHIKGGNKHQLGDARTLSYTLDIRTMDGPAFLAELNRILAVQAKAFSNESYGPVGTRMKTLAAEAKAKAPKPESEGPPPPLSTKKLDKVIEGFFKKYSNRVQINMMDLGKITKAGQEANANGTSIGQAVVDAIKKYRVGGAQVMDFEPDALGEAKRGLMSATEAQAFLRTQVLPGVKTLLQGLVGPDGDPPQDVEGDFVEAFVETEQALNSLNAAGEALRR